MIFIIASLVDTLTLLKLCGTITERRYKPVIHWCLVTGIIIIGCGMLQIFYIINPWLKLPCMFLWFFSTTFLYKGSWFHKSLITALHFNISVVFETVLLTVAMAVSTEAIELLTHNPTFMLFLILTSRFILIVTCLLLSKLLLLRRKQIKLPIREWIIILLIAGFAIFEAYITSVDLILGPSILVSIRVLLFLFMNIALLFQLDKLTEWYQMEREKLALQEQMCYNRQSLQATSEAYENQRRLTHDFDNCLLTISQLLQLGQSNEALSYVSTKLQNVAQADAAVSTNNSIADAVLNQKYTKAREQGIQMHFLINDLSDFPLSTDELVTVLANLLDNALEACQRCPKQEKKIIKVKILLEPALALLSVLNTSLPVNVSNGNIITTKTDSKGHGFGLKNVTHILLKNDFDFAISYEDGWFQFTGMKVLL